jgi:hypothetical protein
VAHGAIEPWICVQVGMVAQGHAHSAFSMRQWHGACS